MEKIRAIISDFDGPLNDSFFPSQTRIKLLAMNFGTNVQKEERILLAKLWGQYGPTVLEKALGLSTEQAAEMYRRWEIWDIEDPLPLIQGSRDVLFNLAQEGYRIALLTSRNRDNIVALLKRLGIFDFFDVISTYQDSQYKKPDPRAFEFILKEFYIKYEIQKEDCIYIGDTLTDMQAGVNASIRTLCVLSGPHWRDCWDKNIIPKENIILNITYLPHWLDTRI